VYEEGMRKVTTVRDFTQIFDVYATFEESLLTAEMESSSEGESKDEWKIEMKLARFERLMDRRPFLVNDVVLRQNPHNIKEWQARVKLWGEDVTQVTL
jgi:pre-mRNA-splicing factor SYF1